MIIICYNFIHNNVGIIFCLFICEYTTFFVKTFSFRKVTSC